MSRKYVVLMVSVFMGLIWSCDVSEADNTASIEASLMRSIAADDSTYGIDGMEDIEDDDFALEWVTEASPAGSSIVTESLRDSNYVWRFSRRNMSETREVIIEVEDDSSALALITYHITGTFHIRQFQRVWTNRDHFERGDSVRFSEKPIDMTSNRRVAYRKRHNAAGEEEWLPVAMTHAYSQSGNSVDIEAMEWVTEDSVRVMTDFASVLYDRRRPLLLSLAGTNRINILVSNNVPGASERLTSRLGYHPRMDGPGLRNHLRLNYVETNDIGYKIYSTRIMPPSYPQRHFKGFVEVMDHRTLFDHDYAFYSVATLGFVYTARYQVSPE